MSFQRLKNALRNIKDYFSYLTGAETATFFPATQAERKLKRERFFTIIIILAVITIILCFFVPWNKFYIILSNRKINDENWLGFIGSFWGAIIGAALAGATTVFTTWLIIKRSYKVDYHRERMEHLPIIQITIKNDVLKELRKSKDPVGKMHNIGIWVREFEGLKNESLVYEMKNVGPGIAINIRMPEIGKTVVYGTANFPTLCAGESVLFVEDFSGHREATMKFLFFDIFDNLYQQKYKYKHDYENDTYSLIMEMPELLIKTKRIRYMQ